MAESLELPVLLSSTDATIIELTRRINANFAELETSLGITLPRHSWNPLRLGDQGIADLIDTYNTGMAAAASHASVSFTPLALNPLARDAHTMLATLVPSDTALRASLAGGGGGGQEIVIDFQNGVYTVDGEAVALGDVVAEDQVNYGTFDPDTAIVDGTGLIHNGDGPVFSGEALSRILAGATLIVDVSHSTASSTSMSLDIFDAGNFNLASAIFTKTAIKAHCSGQSNDDISVSNSAALRFACTFTPSGLSINSGTADIAQNSVPEALVGFGIGVQSDGAIRKISIIPAVADEDLRALCIPDDAKVHIDLVQQFAWTEADGFVEIDTLLGSDPNTENAWGGSNFDPETDLTADGMITLSGGSGIAAAVGAARNLINDGATAVIRLKQSTNNPSTVNILYLSADGEGVLEFDINTFTRSVEGASWNGNYDDKIDNILNALDGSSGPINVVAITKSAARVEFAANRSDPVSSTLTTDDVPTESPLVAFAIGSSVNAIQSITLYDPLPSTDGLSALSETGVVNTAPTAIVLEWQFPISASTGATDVEIDSSQNGADMFVAAVLRADDPEGNPCTTTLRPGGDARITLLPDVFPQIRLDASGGLTSDDVISFTLRATDPGGLYVEQMFTITVTA